MLLIKLQVLPTAANSTPIPKKAPVSMLLLLQLAPEFFFASHLRQIVLLSLLNFFLHLLKQLIVVAFLFQHLGSGVQQMFHLNAVSLVTPPMGRDSDLYSNCQAPVIWI